MGAQTTGIYQVCSGSSDQGCRHGFQGWRAPWRSLRWLNLGNEPFFLSILLLLRVRVIKVFGGQGRQAKPVRVQTGTQHPAGLTTHRLFYSQQLCFQACPCCVSSFVTLFCACHSTPPSLPPLQHSHPLSGTSNCCVSHGTFFFF